LLKRLLDRLRITRALLMPMRWCLASTAVLAAAANMNPMPYPISNLLGPYSTEYTSEFFDVYSPPIRTRYGEVTGGVMPKVPLDPKIVSRFANKTMAIVGYEVDHVYRSNASGAADTPIPIFHVYNHHYMAFLHSPYASVEEVPEGSPHAARHARQLYRTRLAEGAPRVPSGSDQTAPDGVPLSQMFSEGNGGEMRQSWHGYPKGYAQLLYSPSYFAVADMSIDTKNRDHPTVRALGPLPKAAYGGAAPADQEYSGLLECPCTDRIDRAQWKPFPASRCPAQPTSDLGFIHNPTCQADTYVGGIMCCDGGNILLDKDQNPWQDDIMTYYLKFRFYFQEYTPGSHLNLQRLYWQTEVAAGEYDIVQCDPGTPPSQCVYTITSRWSVRQMGETCSTSEGGACTGLTSADPAETAGVELIYAGPHCHAPSCLSMELYHANTGKLLCHMDAQYGASDELYDEKGYVHLPPCLWGHEDGLPKPLLLGLDDELLSIKRNNNTYYHYGDMASWQMRGVVVPKASSEKVRNIQV